MAKKNNLPTFVGEGDIAAPGWTKEDEALMKARELKGRKCYEIDEVSDLSLGGLGDVMLYKEDGTPVGKSSAVRRGLLAVAVWGRLEAVKFVNSVRVGKSDQTFIRDDLYRIYLMTNRTVRVEDKGRTFFCYVPLENVVYFTIDAESIYEQSFKKLAHHYAKREEEA